METDIRKKLFDHIWDNYGKTLVDDELQEIISICQPPKPYPYTADNEPELKWVFKESASQQEQGYTREQMKQIWDYNGDDECEKNGLASCKTFDEYIKTIPPSQQTTKPDVIKSGCDKHDWQLIAPNSSRCRKCGAV
jgi:hypothetical protein